MQINPDELLKIKLYFLSFSYSIRKNILTLARENFYISTSMLQAPIHIQMYCHVLAIFILKIEIYK